MRNRICFVVSVVFLVLTIAAPRPASGFVTFESGQVRPLALSPDGSRLFAVNTPDARLEIFDVSSGSLTHIGSVPVGMEPVAVAAEVGVAAKKVEVTIMVIRLSLSLCPVRLPRALSKMVW